MSIVAKYTELPRRRARPDRAHARHPRTARFDEASIRDQEAYFRDAGQLTYEGEADLASVLRPEILAAANAFLEANP